MGRPKKIKEDTEDMAEGDYLGETEEDVYEEQVPQAPQAPQVPEIPPKDDINILIDLLSERLDLLSERVDKHHRVIVQDQKYIVKQAGEIKRLQENFNLLLEATK